MNYDLEFFDDAAAFLGAAGALLAAEPLRSTVVASVTARIVRYGTPPRAPGQPADWWVVVRDGDSMIGAAMRTAPFVPFPVYLLPMPDAAAVALARLLHARGEEVFAVHGSVPAVDVFAAETAALSGRTVRTLERMRLHEVTAVVEPPRPLGVLRRARPDEVDLVLSWFDAFAAEAAEQAGSEDPHSGPIETRDSTLARIENGEVGLWEHDGAVVHLTAHNPTSFGVARIGPVLTPKEHRGQGYAAAAVAEVSRALLEAGARVCLFTDRANLTSNALYERLGYRGVAETANLVIT